MALLLSISPTPGWSAPSQGSITLTPSAPAPGAPVTVAWTLNNTKALDITGKIVYYLNTVPLTAQSPAAATTIKGGKSMSGSFTIVPVPGVNEIFVTLLDTSKFPKTVNKPPILQVLAPGQTPKPQPNAALGIPTVQPEQVFLASATTSIYVAGQVASISQNGLTAADRAQLLSDYAPLLLYSYQGSDETYRPIDAVAFVQASNLESKITGSDAPPFNQVLSTSDLLASPSDILNPSKSLRAPNGTITSATPVNLYLNPSGSAQSGTAWVTVMQRAGQSNQNDVGLYGRALLLNLNTMSTSDPALPTVSLQGRYGCLTSGSCSAQIIKLEYWQLFGYSHDAKSGTSRTTDHLGDWCTVQVYVDASWWKSARPDRAILYVFHYFHGKQAAFDLSMASAVSTVVPARPAGDTRPTYSAQEYRGPNYGTPVDLPTLGQTDQGPITDGEAAAQLSDAQNNTLRLATAGVFNVQHPIVAFLPASYRHPVVYVEWGGHEFWPTDQWMQYGANNHNGQGTYSYFGSRPVDVTVAPKYQLVQGAELPVLPAQTDVALVTLFAGYWGEPQPLNGPPQGPPLHCEWYWDPNTYAPLLSALQSGQKVDAPSLQRDLLVGKCGGGRPF
jgi:hypothetical protein